MSDTEKIPLVVSEVTGLWNGYMGDSLAKCVFRYFLNNVNDEETRSVLQYALSLSEQHIKRIEDIFNQENISIPQAFGEEDVNINAPRLFTDSYYLFYLNTMAGFGIEAYALFLRYAARADMRDHFSKCINEAIELYNKVADIRLSKGLYLKAPRVEVTKERSFIEDTSFFKGLLSQDRRSILSREATNLFSGILLDIILRATATGFGQVAKSSTVQEYMFKGKNIAVNHLEGFSSNLNKEGIPAPSVSESYVTDSMNAPFSDKLMMFHIQQLCTFALIVDGSAVASSLRNDLTALHLRYAAELAKYAKDGAKIMIANGWLEQPLQVIKHENLVTV